MRVVKNLKYQVSFLFMFLCLMPVLFAQNSGSAGVALTYGFNARSMAMSNAMSSVTTEGTYNYYNPAHAALYSETRQADITVGALSFDRVYQTLGVSVQMPPTAGFALYIIRSGINNINGRTQSGYPTGSFDASEYQIGSSFGIRLSKKINAGIGIKFSIANYHEDLQNPVSVGIDLGILYNIRKSLNFSLVAQDLFASYEWNAGSLYGQEQFQETINDFPLNLKSGLTYYNDTYHVSAEYRIGIYNNTIRTQEVFIDNGVPVTIGDEEQIRTHTNTIRVGGAYHVHERISLRAGINWADMDQEKSLGYSSGFSLYLPYDLLSPSIDYAFVLEPNRLSRMHVFSIKLNF